MKSVNGPQMAPWPHFEHQLLKRQTHCCRSGVYLVSLLVVILFLTWTNLAATSLKPLVSKRLMISPHSPLWTPSGFTAMKVRSMSAEEAAEKHAPHLFTWKQWKTGLKQHSLLKNKEKRKETKQKQKKLLGRKFTPPFFCLQYRRSNWTRISERPQKVWPIKEQKLNESGIKIKIKTSTGHPGIKTHRLVLDPSSSETWPSFGSTFWFCLDPETRC